MVTEYDATVKHVSARTAQYAAGDLINQLRGKFSEQIEGVRVTISHRDAAGKMVETTAALGKFPEKSGWLR